MPTLPPSPFCSALAPAMGAERPLPSGLADHSIAAAEVLPSVTPACAPTTAAAGANAAADFLDDISDVHEIFYHARLLIAEDNAVHRRFVLNEAAFMEAIEPPPLFLQRHSA